MNNEFNLKELYEVRIKSTYPMEFNGRKIDVGETLAYFDSIQISNFQDVTKVATARGGWDNRGLVFWETTNEVNISFAQGKFSKEQFALMSNMKLITEANNSIKLSQREYLESDETGQIELKYVPIEHLFIYNQSTGEKIIPVSISENIVTIENEYCSVIVDYEFNYQSEYQNLVIGQHLTNGFVELEGRTRIKDDITGQTHTGIIKIPRLKLMSDISIRLGRNAQPIVSTLRGTAVPIGDRKNTRIMDLLFLDDDIDSDM